MPRFLRYSDPRSDRYRTVEPEVMLPFLCLRERDDQKLLSPALVDEFCLLGPGGGEEERPGIRVRPQGERPLRRNPSWSVRLAPTRAAVDSGQVYPGNSSGVRNNDLFARRLLGDGVSTAPATAALAQAGPPGEEETYLATSLTSPVWTNWGATLPQGDFQVNDDTES
jgi:hypothetical protein